MTIIYNIFIYIHKIYIILIIYAILYIYIYKIYSKTYNYYSI